jgi:Transposase and inactivated derivatives, IS5 family
MLVTRNLQPSLWESVLPDEVRRLSPLLERVDRWLDDEAFFAPFRPHFSALLGRPSIPMEVYLRMMFLKFQYRLGYESLCREVSDSISWRIFCRLNLDDAVPAPSTLSKITTRCGEDAVLGLNEALLARADAARLVKTGKVRADTTVVSANVVYPTDSGLLAHAVTRIGKLVGRIKAAGGATRTVFRDATETAVTMVHAIGAKLKLRTAQAKEEAQATVLRLTGELADLADQAIADAGAVLDNARRALGRVAGRQRGSLRKAINELSTMVIRSAKVVAQTRQRVAGNKVDSATRLVSLHDPDARPIVKGRLGKPVEFGYKAQVVDNEDGLVLDYDVKTGNPADAEQLAPGDQTHPQALRPYPRQGDRRPWLRRGRGRPRTRRTRRPDRGHPPQRQARQGKTGGRALARLPRPGQMANRQRRTHQPPQTPLRLEPQPRRWTPPHHRLVRLRDPRPQPGHSRPDRGQDRMNSAAGAQPQPTPNRIDRLARASTGTAPSRPDFQGEVRAAAIA